ncbi:unnamed protein product [Lactuca saligna]|uniref:Uncharacterized protein n=1 Tax=Lactuca saligna TaxID=75948 RepID=A0AA36EN05_LACSI|nr:unnamed protein product [Lactuca saligna]
MADSLVLHGTMRARTDWVTAIATPIDNSEMIVTSSRDKSIIFWRLTMEDKTYGVAHRRLTGHSHFVQDVVLSSDGQNPVKSLELFSFKEEDAQTLLGQMKSMDPRIPASSPCVLDVIKKLKEYVEDLNKNIEKIATTGFHALSGCCKYKSGRNIYEQQEQPVTLCFHLHCGKSLGKGFCDSPSVWKVKFEVKYCYQPIKISFTNGVIKITNTNFFHTTEDLEFNWVIEGDFGS